MENGDQSKADVGANLVAVCQMNSTNDVERNLGICEDLIRKAKTRGAKVIVSVSKGVIKCILTGRYKSIKVDHRKHSR